VLLLGVTVPLAWRRVELRNPWKQGLGEYLSAPAFCAAGFVLGRIVHARGRRAQQAEASAVSHETVKSRVARILMKLGARDRVRAVIAAYEAGLLRPGED
jgi:hypothetical protein